MGNPGHDTSCTSWQETREGLVADQGCNPGDPDSYMLIRPVGTMYRLCEVAHRSMGFFGFDTEFAHQDIWESASVEGCKRMYDHIKAHNSYKTHFANAPKVEVSRPTHVEGVTMLGTRDGGNINVYLYQGDYIVGRSQCHVDEWRAAWVLGRPTISGATTFDRELIGHKLAPPVYALCEELAGLPRVPHGRNGVNGSLSQQGQALWVKRAAHQAVPGFGDPVVDARNRRLKAFDTTLCLESRERTKPMATTMISLLSGWPLETSDPDLADLNRAWCRVDDNQVATLCGLEPRSALVDEMSKLVRAYNAGWTPVVRTLDARAYLMQKAAGSLDGRDSVEAIDAVVGSMIEHHGRGRDIAVGAIRRHYPGVDLEAGLAAYAGLVYDVKEMGMQAKQRMLVCGPSI